MFMHEMSSKALTEDVLLYTLGHVSLYQVMKA